MSLLEQAQSVERLRSNIRQEINERFPRTINGYTFDVRDISFEDADTSPVGQVKAFDEDITLDAPVRGTIVVSKDGQVVETRKNVVLARIPQITDRGTYIVGGNDKVILNRTVMRPGVYVHGLRDKNKTQIIQAEVRAGRQRFVVIFDAVKKSLFVENLPMEFGKTNPGKISAVALLKIMGATDAEIKSAIGDEPLYEAIRKNEGNNSSVSKIFAATHVSPFPGGEAAEEKIRAFFPKFLTFGESGKNVTAVTLGEGHDYFSKEAFLQTIEQMIKEYKQAGSTPDPDDLRFKSVESGEDVLAQGFAKGLDNWINSVLRNYGRGRKEELDARPQQFIHKHVQESLRGREGETGDVINPLTLLQTKQKLITSGITSRSARNENRDLQDTAFAKIDPIETPQSHQLGLIQHLSKDAQIKHGRIYSSFYKVRNGVVDQSRVIDDLDPIKEYDEYVAFNDPKQLEKVGGNLTLKGDSIRARHRGDFVNVRPEQVTLIDKAPDSIFGYAAALIPFGAHNDGARMLMGANMQGQAMALKDLEAPLVQSLADRSGKTMEQLVAEKASFMLHSPVAGKVKAITDNHIEIEDKDGKVHKVEKLNYFTPGKMGGYINHQPVVKVGDAVKEGGLLADGWQSKNGQLALGKNALIAYMPFKGYNFEDGVVVSESFANRMASEEVKVLEYDLPAEVISGSPQAKKLLGDLHVAANLLSNLDNDGVIKKGVDVVPGDILVGAVKPKTAPEMGSASAQLAGLLSSRGMFNLPSDQYANVSRRAEGYQKGKVIDVQKVRVDGALRVVIKLLSYKPMEEGDKLAGRHGNKGTITKILPDAEMPQTPDGKALEVLFSPLAIPSRKNLGQLFEVNAGLIAMKKGQSVYKVQNFDPDASEEVKRGLKEIGLPDGKMKLKNPDTGKDYEHEVTVGPMYILKLKHKVESKITQRNNSMNPVARLDPVTMMPKKVSGSIDGDRTNPQGVGGMEFWSLTSGGAVHNVHEMTTLKSDGGGDRKARIDTFNAIRRGTKIQDPMTPETLKVLRDKLRGAGIEMTPLKGNQETTLDEAFTNLALAPATKDAMDKLGAKPLTTHKGVIARTMAIANGGIYDKELFGENMDKWAKIDLAEPLPNPLFMNQNGPRPYEAMLAYKGLSQTHLNDLMDNGKFIVIDPKNSGIPKYTMLDAKQLEELERTHGDKLPRVETGGAAMHALLKEVDLKAAFADAERRLNEANQKETKTSLDARNRAAKHMRVLAEAIRNKMDPEDYLMHAIPVLPLKYRNPIINGKTVIEDGINNLYQQGFQIDREYRRMHDEFSQVLEHNKLNPLGKLDAKDLILPEAYAEIQRGRYQNLKHIIGVGEPAMDRSKRKELFGIMHTLSSKTGFLRENMQKKMQDFSGRSVITVDPQLDLNQVGLPEDMAATLFEPHVMRELARQNYNDKQIREHLENRTQAFRDALTKVTENHPVILNRQPSLHRHSMQAFFPVIRWNEDRPRRSIGLNPLVVTGFNADFDGDTMPVHVPLTEAAKKEAIEKLMPSNNLLNPTNNSIIMELKHEMQLGIYYMTMDKEPQGKPRTFATLKDLISAYETGKVSTYDKVTMNVPGKGSVTATAGQHLFNLSLPAGYQDYAANKNIGSKELDKLIRRIIENKAAGGGPEAAVATINKLKNISFTVSTISGMSIGVNDFPKLAERRGEELETAEHTLERPDHLPSGMLDEKLYFEQEKTRHVQGILKGLIGAKGDKSVLPEGNPVKIMMASGARGNAGQINAMSGIIGVGKSVAGAATRPINTSHLEGLSPDQFWDLSYDSRKGIFDKSIATREPGALTRQIWMANKQTVISEHDCGDRTGTVLNLHLSEDREALRGRVLLEPIQLPKGRVIPAKNEPISLADYEAACANPPKDGRAHVRTPLTCKASIGVCQLCYGARAGGMENKLVPLGEPVGSIASQALGEPSQQAIMKTFHTGAGNSSLDNAFARIAQILYSPEELNKSNEAVLARHDGVVTKIQDEPGKGKVVYVNERAHILGEKPLAPGIKEHAEIKQGDSLTLERTQESPDSPVVYHTIRNPHELIKLKGLDATRDYFLRSLQDALESGGAGDTDRRHLEVVLSNMTNKVRVKDGGTSTFLPTRIINRQEAEEFNAMARKSKNHEVDLNYHTRYNVIGSQSARDIADPRNPGKHLVRAGQEITEDVWDRLNDHNFKRISVVPKPIQYDSIVTGVKKEYPEHDPNWLANAAHESATQSLSSGALLGARDRLDNPLTRQMTGLLGNFGDGFHKWKENLDKKLHFGFY